MISLPQSLQRLIKELSRLPSIGEKTATRLAYHLVTSSNANPLQLAEALSSAQSAVRWCSTCFFFAEEGRCPLCSDGGRDGTILCVVEKPMDVLAVERTSSFRGSYHVLHGLWSPLKGRTPESIRIAELLKRVQEGGVREVILATGSTVEGDATALYIARALRSLGVTASRLAQGMPKGGELEYADDVTLSRALAGRSIVTDS
ncbi:MAG: recombination mediator RecR [Bdellovibrionota bacterium]|nr:MAG: recombination mediator RecR [Bdellovibrionota bacterium]